MRQLQHPRIPLFAGCFWLQTFRHGSIASACAVSTPQTLMRLLRFNRNLYVLGSIEWIEIDASGSLPETLERARAAIR